MNGSANKPKKHFEGMTKTELIDELRALENKSGTRLSQPANELTRALHELEVHQVELEMQNRELVESHQLVEESRSRYADLYDFAPVGYVSLDRQGRIHEINLTCAEMLGGERSQLVGRLFSSYVTASDRARFLQHLVDCERSSDRVFSEIKLMPKTGGSLEVELLSVPVQGSEGNTAHCRTAITDITERKRAREALRQSEERLRHAQKMGAVGRLAGGVAHDFNNLLTAILGYCEIATMKLEQGEAPGKELEGIAAGAQRAAALTKQLLAFARKEVFQPRVLDLNDLVAGIDEMLRRLIGEDVEIVIRLDASLGRVRADAGQVEQVIMNLVVNARDAMLKGGRLVIETVNCEIDASGAHEDLVPGSYVMISVSDTGFGMSSETMSRIFEPFFTTKAEGTGLGLATVYGIVRQMNGHISVQSQQGAGTTFKIYLPRVQQDTESPRQVPSDRAPDGTETILLVEDEPSVREIAASTLRARGYEVLEASNGEEALNVARNHRGPKIRLLITDVIMPKMGGRKLAERLSDRDPAMKILYMSGHPGDMIGNQGELDSETHFLQKPFISDALSFKVREVLDA